jgi:hypothetical protein
MTLYQVLMTIEAPSLNDAWVKALSRVPVNFSPVEAEKAAQSGIRQFSVEAIGGDGAGFQRIEAEFGTAAPFDE